MVQVCASRSKNVAKTEFDSATDYAHTKSWTFLWTGISKTWPQLIRSNVGLLESVTFWEQDRMLISFSAPSLGSYWHFLELGIEIGRSHRHVEKR